MGKKRSKKVSAKPITGGKKSPFNIAIQEGTSPETVEKMLEQLRDVDKH